LKDWPQQVKTFPVTTPYPPPPASTAHNTIASLVAGALGWWQEAGVSHAFADTPADWLARAGGAQNAPRSTPPTQSEAALPAPGKTAPLAAPPPTIGGAPEHWPTSLPAFRAWWLAEPSLAEGPLATRVPPRAIVGGASGGAADGASGAALMVLVPQPEAEDDAVLLSGPQGRLLAAMLGAMGIAPAQTYIASALPRHVPFADWGDLARRGLGAVVAHHITLVAPRRLIVLGDNVSPLLGHNPAQTSAFLPSVNHGEGNVPVLFAHDLGFLIGRPAARAAFWRQWLDWGPDWRPDGAA